MHARNRLYRKRPLQLQAVYVLENRPGAEWLSLPVQNLFQPFRIVLAGMAQTEAMNFERRHFQTHKARRGRIKRRKVHQDKLAAVLFIASNAFVIIEKVTATVEDEFVPVNFDRLAVM